MFNKPVRAEDTPSFRAYHEDILPGIVIHLAWKDLMKMRHCPEPAKTIVEDECRIRIFEELDTFIPRSEIHGFFDALKKSRAAVVGPVARRILQRNTIVEGVAPQELKIVTAKEYGGMIWSFLYRAGYTVVPEEANDGWGRNMLHLENLFRPDATVSIHVGCFVDIPDVYMLRPELPLLLV